jgi:hypothetical protein
MSIIGFIISLLAAFFMLIGLIPFMGWFNWFTTLPLAVVGAIISGLAFSLSKSRLAKAGLIISGAVFLLALVRLVVGCGIF